MRLKEITISGFRGFNDRRTINLDNSVVLIYGLNGSGKSCLVEAIEWLFFDDISRKRRSLCKSEYRGDYLRNTHYDGEENPFVEVKIILYGKERTIRKEIISSRKHDFYIDGQEVENLASLEVPLEEPNKPILAQSEIQRFVDTEQKDRWVEISRILGIDTLNKLRDDLMNLRTKKLGDELYENARRVYESILMDLASVTSLKHIIPIIKEQPYDPEKLLSAILCTLTKNREDRNIDLEEIKKILRKNMEDIFKRDESLKKLIIPEIMIHDLSFSEIEQFVESIQTFALEISESDFPYINNDEYEFLTLGLRLKVGEKCPFCKEMTITPSKEREIRDYISKNKILKEKIGNLDSKLSFFLQKRDTILSSLKMQISELNHLNFIVERIENQEGLKNSAKKLKKIIEETIPKIQRDLSDFELLLGGFIDLCQTHLRKKEAITEDRVNEITASIKSRIQHLSVEISNFRQYSYEFNEDVLKSLEKIPELDEEELKKLMTIQKIIMNTDEIRLFSIWSNHIEMLENLTKSVEIFEKEKAKQLLQVLSKEIEKYYNQLNPQEPMKFCEIIPTEGTQRHAKIMAESYGKEINPVTCFSESHMNCLGLSIYFSQRVDHNPEWGFAILDDPVQSMDINHSGKLLDILFEESKSKQIVVLTHEKRFCDDFHDKFYYEKLLEYEFSGYDKKGPKIEIKKAPLENCLEIIRFHAKGSRNEREEAATALRKAVEILCLDMLIQKFNHAPTQARRIGEKGPEGFLDKLEKINQIDRQDIAELRRIIDITNPQTHATMPKDVSTADLLDGVKRIEEIRDRYLCLK